MKYQIDSYESLMRRLSPSMADVLEWLLIYPNVEISCLPPGRPSWTAAWGSKKGKEHMVSVIRDLSGAFGCALIERQAQGRWRPRLDTTPRLTQRTFDGLHRRGLIEAKKQRPKREGWSEMFYYQLSAKGEAVAMEIVFSA